MRLSVAWIANASSVVRFSAKLACAHRQPYRFIDQQRRHIRLFLANRDSQTIFRFTPQLPGALQPPRTTNIHPAHGL